ncbi:MAG: glycosyltransferase family 39 protein [Patescibacteria group bacterium]|nr:glycosyltransferase family 39 protein [Patescibacteria group bacterium]
MFNKTKIFLFFILFIASFLRLWKLDEVPVSMFGDELDVGYHAYSILKTGKDYSGNFMPLHFQSLAEWRTPLYLYTSVPTVAIFGISPYGVRLPAAIFGILTILGIYLLAKQVFNKDYFGLIVAFVLALSPWHIQYSRAGFEVTMLLFFLVFGLYFFFYSVRNGGRFFWFSVSLLTLTPLIYSTAKFFTPFLMFFLFLFWFREIFKFSKKEIFSALIFLIFLGLPTFYSTFFGGGTQRFSYISIFTDPTRESEIGTARMLDAYDRNELVEGLQPSFADKFYHNKFFLWISLIFDNLLKSFSTEFLFISGDPNLRHSIKQMGQFYQIDFILLIFGIVFFFASKNITKRHKYFIVFMLIFGALPASLTRDGGNHATRLITILVPLVFLISFGIYYLFSIQNCKLKIFLTGSYFVILLANFIFYSHYYWVHNKYDSERWWHYGFREAITSLKNYEENYDKIIISMYGEPAWIFFAALYPYDPFLWHKGYPFKKADITGFGEVGFIDRYYFGSPQNAGLYDWGKVLPSKSIYLATEKEVKVNLIQEPERTPGDLVLLDAIAYPSGEPAFYLFAKE